MLVYTTVIIKPVIPIVEDAFAHTFAEVIHIATVHAMYGENHLQKELANTSDNDKSKSQNNLKTEDLVPIHICPEVCDHIPYLRVDKNYNSVILYQIASVFLFNEAPPPKFC